MFKRKVSKTSTSEVMPRNALMEAMMGDNAMNPPPMPKSAKSLKGLKPNTGTTDESKLNKLKASKGKK